MAFEKNGLFDELKKVLAERALNAEMDTILRRGERGRGQPPQWLRQKDGADRYQQDGVAGSTRSDGRFNPQLIAKHQRHFPGFDEKIVSMYARGMSTREIQGHLGKFYGLEVSPDLISTVTDQVLDEVAAWRTATWKRPIAWSSSTRRG